MKAIINKNSIDTQDLIMPLSNLIMADKAKFAVTAIRDNYAYENGKKTDTWQSVTLSCVDAANFAVLDIKVTSHIPLTQQDIDNSQNGVFAEFPLEQTLVRIYAVEFGRAKVIITAPTAKIVSR